MFFFIWHTNVRTPASPPLAYLIRTYEVAPAQE